MCINQNHLTVTSAYLKYVIRFSVDFLTYCLQFSNSATILSKEFMIKTEK